MLRNIRLSDYGFRQLGQGIGGWNSSTTAGSVAALAFEPVECGLAHPVALLGVSTHASPVAGPTVPIPIGGNPDVVASQRVPVFAVRDSVRRFAEILSVRGCFEVRRVDAPGCIALVMNLGAVRRRAKVMLVHPAMDQGTP